MDQTEANYSVPHAIPPIEEHFCVVGGLCDAIKERAAPERLIYGKYNYVGWATPTTSRQNALHP